MFKSAFTFIWLCLAILSGFGNGLEVVDDNEIQVIENGSVDEIILECPYTLSEGDTNLMVQWYYGSEDIHAYQWVVGHPPAMVGEWEKHIDGTYEISDDDNTRFSALRILNPTTEFNGKYICKVSTFEDEKKSHKEVLIYNKPARVVVSSKEEGDDKVKVTCSVEEVYPEPEVTLHMMEKGSSDRITLEGVEQKKSWSEGLYSATLELSMDEDDLEGPTEFVCEATIPKTEVKEVRRSDYQPRVQEKVGAVKTVNAGNVLSTTYLLISLVFLGIMRF